MPSPVRRGHRPSDEEGEFDPGSATLDAIWFTDDDVVDTRDVIEHDSNGNLATYTRFAGQGDDYRNFSDEYDSSL